MKCILQALLFFIGDDNDYTIAKLKDGKCWMTQNLRIIDKQLTSVDSNINGNFFIPKTTLNEWYVGTWPKGWLDAYAYIDQDHGGYYTWYAATAGSAGEQSIDAPYSICPFGWHLPHNGEFKSLINYYTYSTITQPPQNFTYSGRINAYTDQNASIIGQEQEGHYWTSSGADTHGVGDGCSYGDACGMNFFKSSQALSIGSWGQSCYGRSVRCMKD